MKVAVFSTKPYDRKFLSAAIGDDHELTFFEPRLTAHTAGLAAGFPAVCAFVNDEIDASACQRLADGGTRLIAMRCAGFNNVDVIAANQHDLKIVRVPAYSPYAVAEHAVGLMLALNRHLTRAFNRVREGNFALNGLLGFDMRDRTVGILGTGKIGAIVAGILKGFGCRLLAHDVHVNPDCEALGVEYVERDRLLAESDIITLHCPLMPATFHLIDKAAIEKMKPQTMLINTSRGGLIDTRAVIQGMKSGKIGYLGLDVYEEEGDLFFEDLSDKVIQDDTFSRLLTFPNVLITGHQAFFTEEALTAIAQVTAENLNAFAQDEALKNEVTAAMVRGQT